MTYVTVCLRDEPNVFRRYRMNPARIRTFAGALDELVKRRGVDVVFLPFQQNPASGQGDNQLHETVAQAMAFRNHVQVRPWTADLDEVCRWIQGSRMVISMRLHAAVLAQTYHRATVLMPYDRKITEFGRLMNISHTIEPARLDGIAQVRSVLETAWLDTQEEQGVNDTPGTSVASLWASLRLEPAD
jgi:polysaccharide pyruvyl transferase WcaK-like protein